jgi:Imidazolonepropionase and related amidohydrolases
MIPIDGKTIIVEDKKIAAVINAENADLSYCKVIDLKGQYVLPGLINLHVHLPGSGKPAKKQVNIGLICKNSDELRSRESCCQGHDCRQRENCSDGRNYNCKDGRQRCGL